MDRTFCGTDTSQDSIGNLLNSSARPTDSRRRQKACVFAKASRCAATGRCRNAKRVSELAFEHPLRLYSSILNQEGSLLSKKPIGQVPSNDRDHRRRRHFGRRRHHRSRRRRFGRRRRHHRSRRDHHHHRHHRCRLHEDEPR
jgi:hypothetical protein